MIKKEKLKLRSIEPDAWPIIGLILFLLIVAVVYDQISRLPAKFYVDIENTGNNRFLDELRLAILTDIDKGIFYLSNRKNVLRFSSGQLETMMANTDRHSFYVIDSSYILQFGDKRIFVRLLPVSNTRNFYVAELRLMKLNKDNKWEEIIRDELKISGLMPKGEISRSITKKIAEISYKNK